MKGMEPTCRICNNSNVMAVIDSIHGEYNDSYSLYRCPRCGFHTTHPIPTDEILSQYYTKEYWNDGKPGRLTTLLYHMRSIPLLRQLRKAIPSPAKVLDWGAGDGAWLTELQNAGYEAWGLDTHSPPNLTNWITGDIHCDELASHTFDAITCLHVLEHTKEPSFDFSKAMSLLRPGGVLLLEVPNIDSLSFKLFGPRWQPLQIPTHINHFTSESIKTMVARAGDCHIDSISFFSLRTSPAALLLSMFPNLAPRIIRKNNHGRFPAILKLFYLGMQAFVLPISLAESLVGKGAIMRLGIESDREEP